MRKTKNTTPISQVGAKTPEDIIAIAKKNNITTNPLDLLGLCHILGLGVQFSPLQDNISGKLHHDGTRWTINVNSLHHTRRQRFTIAHELGHYFLHRDSQDTYEEGAFHRGKEYNTTELEADNFAGALLMPKKEFKDFVQNTSNKIDDIAEYFGTSSVAIKKRADVIRNNSYEF